MTRPIRAALAAMVVYAAAAPAFSQLSPPVNLGFTSFLDGGPPAGPGFYFQEYIQYWTADEFKNGSGSETHLLDDLDIVVSLNQFIYQSDQPVLFGGKWGIDVIVPVIGIKTNTNIAPVISDGGDGIGDIVIGPFIQWDPIMGENGPIFMHRIELQNIIPTGKYDDGSALNPGSNFYSFNPYWAGTLWLQPRWTATCRLHYLWNDKNDDPYVFFGGNDTQAGEAIHLNFASAYELLPRQLHVGINGYYFKQITDSKVNGSDTGYREQVLGIGPGAVWHFSPDDHLFFNLYFETEAENRPEGVRMTLRWTHHF